MKRILIFSSATFIVSLCTVGFTAKMSNMGTIKIEDNPAHFAVNTCHIGKAWEDVQFYGGAGVTTDGKKFEISADGSGGWVEMHIGKGSGAPEAFYTAALKNPEHSITVDSQQVTIKGQFDEAITEQRGIPFELTATCEG